ncbi:CGNR zinc finger domain-containing protein [Cellulomonas sp. ES6]|uniref:CGNR zinc finger domain-containing protein n=1 Tax=Cellulomonas sp. ES6 TaxID=3039384 RepID=UPI0024B80A5C|nr:CGNR zinc finger domain-containing protein [Cellulomonas sp. ES6]WHP17877.1 CGNR zinc finger domain-containing protein [Cellulomonas sp. ES6]
MHDDTVSALLAVAATRPEGPWPDQLDVDAFRSLLSPVAPTAARLVDDGAARAVRDVLGAVLLDGTDDDALSLLDGLARTHRITPSADRSGVRFTSLGADPAGPVWAEVLVPLMEAVAGGCRRRIRRCASDPCTTPFLDGSPGGTRTFCCDRCATRDRVRRHRADRRG